MKDIHGGNIWEASLKTGIKLESIVDFSSSINPFGLPKGAGLAIRNSIRLIPPYPDPDSGDLKEALSSFHGIPPEELLPGNGSTEFIYLIPRVFSPRRALIVEPAFSEYRTALGLVGCRADSLILRGSAGFSLNIDRLKRRLRNGYDLLYISNPQNPTGTPVGKEDVVSVAGHCAKAGVILIVDEAFADFSEELSVKKDAGKFRNVIVLRSMTKFFSMAGLRLGFLVAGKDTVKKISRLVPPWSVNTMAAFAGVAALKDSAYIEKTAEWLAWEREFLSKGIGNIEGLTPFPSSANFLMVRITPPHPDAPRLRNLLSREGILIRDLSAFRGLGPRYFRIAVRKRSENKFLLDSLKKILE